MVYMFFDKKTKSGVVKNESMSNKELTEELHELIIKKFKKKESILTFYRQYLVC